MLSWLTDGRFAQLTTGCQRMLIKIQERKKEETDGGVEFNFHGLENDKVARCVVVYRPPAIHLSTALFFSFLIYSHPSTNINSMLYIIVGYTD